MTVTEAEALDAYSQVVSGVAEALLLSVASLQIMGSSRGGRRPAGSGSGVVVTPDGYLLTSAHVVSGQDGGRASFADGAEGTFEVVGADKLSDLAVIRVVEPRPVLVAATLGNADELRVGQLVVAIGNESVTFCGRVRI